jgi:hypothetical protein
MLKNPAYPIGHPMNAIFDKKKQIDSPNERKLKSAIQNIEEPLSPTGLSSSSSSFTSNLIAQRFNIAADDPILNNYLG